MTDKQIDLYSKIPNKLFYTTNKNENSILMNCNYNEKSLLVLDYLYIATDRRGIIRFTLEDMIISCGYKCSTKKNESNEQFKKILCNLQEVGVIKSDSNLKEIKPKELVRCTIELNLESQYVKLFDTEKEKILNQTLDKVDNVKLLLFYCYLKCRMYKRTAEDDISISGGRAEVCFPSFKTIHNDLGFTDDTINKYNKILLGLDLIRIGSAGNWYYKDDKNKILRESVNFYTLFTGDEKSAEDNLKEAIKFYKSLDLNSNKIFTNSKKYKNNNKKLGGEYGSIIKKEKHGKATEKDLIRKKEILESINANEGEYKIKALLESNKGELLSDIYFKINLNKSEEYFGIENSLGVVDDEGNLLVDYDYYKWVMVTHASGQYKDDYLINCVKRKNSNVRILNNKESAEAKDDIWGDVLESLGFDDGFEEVLG